MDRLNVPGTLDSLELIGKYVMEAAHEAGLDRKDAYRLRLAVDELATNVVMHGYQEAGLTGTISVWADIDSNRLVICIEDAGIPYDPTATPAPDDLDEPLEDREIGGLGVFLARRGVDELHYERVDDHNRSILVMNCTTPRPQGNAEK
jgi:anti-sigma regulatory factor (Ser/Thr protein kinase)